jgi:hypothetical protein
MSFRGEPIQIEFGPANDRLTVMFYFSDFDFPSPPGSTDWKPEWSVESEDPRFLTLTLRNFRAIMASGNEEPIKLGTLAGSALFCNFRVVQVGSEKMLHYAFYARPQGAMERGLTEMTMKHNAPGSISDLIQKDPALLTEMIKAHLLKKDR